MAFEHFYILLLFYFFRIVNLCYNIIMKTDYIKPSIYKKVYSYMQYENALALRLSLETGMRITDVLSLEVKQLKGKTITFTAQKTGKTGKKVISADLVTRLKQISGKKWIFTGRFGNKPRTRQTVWKDVKNACKLLNISENVACHSARKTYAVELFHSDGLLKVQKELQHDRADTTMLYAFADLLTEKNLEVDKTQDIVVLAELIADILYKRIEHLFEEYGIKKTPC